MKTIGLCIMPNVTSFTYLYEKVVSVHSFPEGEQCDKMPLNANTAVTLIVQYAVQFSR